MPTNVTQENVTQSASALQAVGFRIPQKVKGALLQAANADMRSLSSLVEKVVTEWALANNWLDDRSP